MYFNVPYTSEDSISNVKKLIEHPSSVNDAEFLIKCKSWFEDLYPGYTAYMTTSCTRAMEMISLSLNFEQGDEIILSPYNYVGVGNAFANYRAKLVFTDIDASTMNIDASLIEASITEKTRAVIAMHYAGIPCAMETIRSICEQYNLLLIEDNAQGILNSYKGQLLGSFGDFSCISFDPLKNISCYEGGVLLCKHKWKEAVDVAFNNGTNKMAFFKGLVHKYEWVDKGSKFSMSEYTAAVLYPLLVKSENIIRERKKIWKSLYEKIRKEESLRRFIPQQLLDTEHNAHLAYLKFDDFQHRSKVLDFMNTQGVPCSFHYVPLDDSIEGKKVAQSADTCAISLRESNCLLRLPMHNYLKEEDLEKIVRTLVLAIKSI